MVDIQWIIGGEAGYGIMTTGHMMAKIFTRLGLSVYDYVEYPSLIRGGHNAYYVRTSDVPMYSQKKPVDILVALNRDTIDKHKHELHDQSAIIYDPASVPVQASEFETRLLLIPVPLLEITKKVGADKLMTNTVAIGASLALCYPQFDVIEKIMQDTFGRKGEQVVGININTAKGGFDYVRENYSGVYNQTITSRPQGNLLVGGAEIEALGAIRAGVKFAAIYPMTPINGVMATLAANALKYSIVVKEPEDEIAGINMAIGASFAGVRSMVATSGGGFSLMVEAMGLAAISEEPVVVIMGMRPGPATGMPTWTEQGDLRFVLHAAQGDFPRIVIAPGDHLEAFEQTMHAFNLAEKYQLPVIVLVDKYLNEGHATVDAQKMKSIHDSFKIERGKILRDEDLVDQTDYRRYALVEDGISPRSLPGQKGGIALNGSDEHDERGLYNEEADVRIHMMNKRYKKLETAIKDGEFPAPELHGEQDAPLTIVSWGSTKMPILEAMEWLKRDGKSVNFIQVKYMNPFPVESFAEMIGKTQKTLVIENNYSGQFEGLVRERTGITFHERFRKFNGRPFYPEEIVEKVTSLL
jgi:2-oxoglutarate/2-oxoacid ferredoxin oxidoreductase subunit alpha